MILAGGKKIDALFFLAGAAHPHPGGRTAVDWLYLARATYLLAKIDGNSSREPTATTTSLRGQVESSRSHVTNELEKLSSGWEDERFWFPGASLLTSEAGAHVTPPYR